MKIDSRLAERTKKVNPSSTLALTSKAKKMKAEGKDVVSFAAGEPDFDTPEEIKKVAIEAIQQGFTKYTPTVGIPELRSLISEKFKRDNNLSYPPEQIIVSCGAKHSIFNALFVLVNRAQEVLIPSPYWVSYPEMVNLCDAKPVFVKTTAENNFKIQAGELERYITSKTKVLILNSPSNPTGCVYTKNELQEIARICVQHKIFVISDEIYEKLVYDNLVHYSIASFNKEIYDLTVTVNGLSKSHSMTGWRIGFLGGPRDITDAISKVQDHTTSNPVSISQKAAVAALQMSPQSVNSMVSEFKKRRDYLIKRLSQIPQLSCVVPHGAFYVLCDISKTAMDSVIFAERLLQETYVALIPGEGFGRNDCVRFSFATSMERIDEGMTRLEQWLKKAS